MERGAFVGGSPSCVFRGYNSGYEMIRVSRLNGKEFVVNAELIQFVEETPDTVITLLNHEKIVVREKADDVVRRVIEYQKSIRGFHP
jgi:flagellar protein FlbD